MKEHTIIYGSAIHAAVQYYFEAKKRNMPDTVLYLSKYALDDFGYHELSKRLYPNEE